MSDKPQQDRAFSQSFRNANLHHFVHPAMATMFELFIIHEEAKYASQAAQAAWKEVDRLELELSRFNPNSEISQLNALQPGEVLVLGPDAFAALKAAKEFAILTEGAFDAAVGALVDHYKSDAVSQSPVPAYASSEAIELDENLHAVAVTKPVRVDLGGIGKGYAADRIAELLKEWSIENALIAAGTSTLLALDGPDSANGWPVTISDPRDRTKAIEVVHLENESLASSGLEKGSHIVDPRKGAAVSQKHAAWVRTKSATAADALSTAFMIMDTSEVSDFCEQYCDVLVMMLNIDSGNTDMRYGGNWKWK